MAYAGILKNRHIKHWFTKNQTFLKRLINNIITSGRFDNCDYEIRRKIILLNIICVIGIISLCFQGFSVLAGNNLLIGVLDLSAALLLSFNILLLRRGDYYSFVSQSSIVLIAVLFYYLLISGGILNTGFLWYFTFPLCAVFLLGSRKGVIAALILLFFTLLFFFNEHNSTIFTIYTPEFESRFVLTFLLVLSFSYIFENMRERTQYRIAQNNKKFEKLISELKEKDKLLCNLHNNLELRVSERTLKLQKEIKQREQAEQELEESVERFRSLYENATIGIYRSTPSGKVLMANPALIRMLGYNSFEEISKIDLNYSGYMEMDGRKKFIELLEEKNSVSGLEAAWEKKDGNKVFLRESAAAIRDKKGKTLYYEGTVEDITIQKKLDEQLSQPTKWKL